MSVSTYEATDDCHTLDIPVSVVNAASSGVQAVTHNTVNPLHYRLVQDVHHLPATVRLMYRTL